MGRQGFCRRAAGSGLDFQGYDVSLACPGSSQKNAVQRGRDRISACKDSGSGWKDDGTDCGKAGSAEEMGQRTYER